MRRCSAAMRAARGSLRKRLKIVIRRPKRWRSSALSKPQPGVTASPSRRRKLIQAPASLEDPNDASISQHPCAPWRRRPPRPRRRRLHAWAKSSSAAISSTSGPSHQVKTGMNAEQVLQHPRHAVDRVHRRQQILVLHQPAIPRAASIHAASSVVDQQVTAVYFDQNLQGRARRALRAAGRQGLRLHQPHDAGRRRGPNFLGQLFQGLGSFNPLARTRRSAAASGQPSSASPTTKKPRGLRRGVFRSARSAALSCAPGSPAAAARRCW